MSLQPAKTETYTVWGVHRDNNQTWGGTVEVPADSTPLEILEAMFKKFCLDNQHTEQDIADELAGDKRTPDQIEDDKIENGIFPFIRFTDIFPGDVRAIWSSNYYEE